MTRSISAINDRLLPKNKEDRSVPYHWWPKEGTTEWIAYEFSEKRASVAVVFSGSMMVPGAVAELRKAGVCTTKTARVNGHL